MEKLILKCGRFVPPVSGDAESRVRLIEAYLSKLTEELEFMVGEMDRTLDALEAAVAERDGLAAVAMAADHGEGSV